MESKYYTLIGSRSTPEDIMQLLEGVAAKLNNQGWTVRSGGADGADSCAEQQDSYLNWSMHIYLPWDGFNGRDSGNRGYINTPKANTYPQACEIAERLHPNWSACSRGARALHTRNVYQIMGDSLNEPSKFVLCWAIPSDNIGNVKGGTGQAVRFALENGIPVYNLYHQEIRDKMIKYLEE